MAKTPKTSPAGQESNRPTDVAEPELALHEWCANVSQTDRRVELLGAFFTIESREGRVKAPPAVFADRYAEFANRPL